MAEVTQRVVAHLAVDSTSRGRTVGHETWRRALLVGSGALVGSVVLAILLSSSDTREDALDTSVAGGPEEEAAEVEAPAERPSRSEPDPATSEEQADTAAPDSDNAPSSDDGEAVATGDPPEAVLSAFIRLTDAALADPSGFDDAALTQVASGSALQELRSLLIEYEATGMHQSGVHEIVALESTSTGEAAVTFDVCLDRSNVQLLREDGSSVLVPERPPTTLQRFVLEHSDAGWQVAAQRFPEPDGC